MFLALVEPIDHIICIPLSLSFIQVYPGVYVARFSSGKFLSLIFTRTSAGGGDGERGRGGGREIRSAMT